MLAQSCAFSAAKQVPSAEALWLIYVSRKPEISVATAAAKLHNLHALQFVLSTLVYVCLCVAAIIFW